MRTLQFEMWFRQRCGHRRHSRRSTVSSLVWGCSSHRIEITTAVTNGATDEVAVEHAAMPRPMTMHRQTTIPGRPVVAGVVSVAGAAATLKHGLSVVVAAIPNQAA